VLAINVPGKNLKTSMKTRLFFEVCASTFCSKNSGFGSGITVSPGFQAKFNSATRSVISYLASVVRFRDSVNYLDDT